MKRSLRILLIFLAVLAFLLILIWPMAPIWEKLGLEMKCIQGTWPDIKFVSCQPSESNSITPVPLPTPGVDGPIPIIVDDDGSPDGMVAMLYFLHNPLFDVRAVTISYGEAHPELFAKHVSQILAAMGRANIPVGYGSDMPLAGANAFPDSWRQVSDEFWGISLPQATDAVAPVPAAELIVETVSSSNRPVVIFVSGAHTNLAEALHLDPGIAGNIRDVYIMGGSVNVPGNIHSDWSEFSNETAEWNIWVDPLAASEVFSSGLNLHLVPLDATRQVVWTQSDLPGWESGSSTASDLAADLLQMMLTNWSPDSVYIWDLVAAVQATDPSVCPEASLGIEIITTRGPNEGRTMKVDGSPNVSVCLDPDPDMVKGLVLSVFQQP
jgi:pyrimidine-specific ribonucleoside hydrolase